jgi:hypothetical protein
MKLDDMNLARSQAKSKMAIIDRKQAARVSDLQSSGAHLLAAN